MDKQLKQWNKKVSYWVLEATHLVVKSEVWRFEWAFRTCVSTAVIAFLCLYPGTSPHIPVPGFAAFATVVTKDLTYGGTIKSIMTINFATLLVSFLCWLVSLGVTRHPAGEAMVIPILFILVFVAQYLEYPPLAKKIAISVIALDILLLPSNDGEIIWDVMQATLLGTAVSIVGTLIPLPPRVAYNEIKHRVQYCSYTVCSLLEDLVYSWQYLSCSSPEGEMMRGDASLHRKHPYYKSLPTSAFKATSSSYFPPSLLYDEASQHSVPLTSAQKQWRKLRLILRVLYVFRRSRNSGLAWYNRVLPFNSHNDRFVRTELLDFIKASLLQIIARNADAQFGPYRRYARTRPRKYIRLINDMLSIISVMEKRLHEMSLTGE